MFLFCLDFMKLIHFVFLSVRVFVCAHLCLFSFRPIYIFFGNKYAADLLILNRNENTIASSKLKCFMFY